MFFLVLSCVWWIAGAWAIIYVHRNNCLIPHLVFEPRDHKWRNMMSSMVYGVVIVLMICLYLASLLGGNLPTIVKVIVWILDAVIAVGMLDVWSHSTHKSQVQGAKYVSTDKPKHKDNRHLHLN